MLSAADVAALVAARHGDPFAVLGLHADANGRLWLRALLPGAQAVAVLDARTGKRVATLALRDPAGLWEGAIARRRKRFDYRLRVQWTGDHEGTYADAFAYGALIPDADLHFFGDCDHTFTREWQRDRLFGLVERWLQARVR